MNSTTNSNPTALLPQHNSILPEPAAEESGKVAPFFEWPVDRARLTRGFLVQRRRPHLGIDLAAPTGTPIFASHHGVVIYAGRDFRGFGKMIIIEAENGWATLYAHLHEILVQEGERITQGVTIAKVGNTGRSTGPHLHFELRKDKMPVDPLPYLPGGSEASRKLASEK